MKNIHVLPTDKPSRLSIKDGVLYLHRLQWIKGAQHIYITSSDEEIKVNDYITDGYKVWQWKDDSSLLGRKKVILTTDAQLIKDGVQAIHNEFLEWFVSKANDSGKPIDIVEVVNDIPYKPYPYEIIIPKEESKQDLEKEMFELEQELDIPSHLRWHNSKPKQETLEEVAFRKRKELSLKGTIEGFIAGFKACEEQNKNMYSEDEVRAFAYNAFCLGQLQNPTENKFNGWFEQFKKK